MTQNRTHMLHLLALLSFPGVTYGQSLAPGASGSATIVSVHPGTDVNALASTYGATVTVDHDARGLSRFVFPQSWSDSKLASTLIILEADPSTLFVEAEASASQNETCNPTGSGSSGQPCTIGIVDEDDLPTMATRFEEQYLTSLLELDPAQGYTSAYRPIVALVDTGIDPTHPAFVAGSILQGHDYLVGSGPGWDQSDGVDDDGDGWIDEGYGHGTHLAGIVQLIDPQAILLPLRVLGSDGTGSALEVAVAIYDAVDAGADIVNLSLTLSDPSAAVASALQYAELNGVSVFVAGGNQGGTVPGFPANYHPDDFGWMLAGMAPLPLDGKEIVTIGGTDEFDIKAGFSTYGDHLDFCAPAVSVYSAFPEERFAWWSGTSMATAVASGVASLTLSSSNGSPAAPVWTCLELSCDPIDNLNPNYSGSLGSGRVDAWAAVLEAVSGN